MRWLTNCVYVYLFFAAAALCRYTKLVADEEAWVDNWQNMVRILKSNSGGVAEEEVEDDVDGGGHRE